MGENPLGGFERRVAADGSEGLGGELLGEAHVEEFLHGLGPLGTSALTRKKEMRETESLARS